ncbi:MAG: hypothetical protein C4517_14775 [Stygiobacter sp.]|nr:MAG: hypothetical protein C4517_14775 [Stygiobacter sp.]
MSKVYNIIFLLIGAVLVFLYQFDMMFTTSISIKAAKELFGIISISGAILIIVALINLYSMREIGKSLPRERS